MYLHSDLVGKWDFHEYGAGRVHKVLNVKQKNVARKQNSSTCVKLFVNVLKWGPYCSFPLVLALLLRQHLTLKQCLSFVGLFWTCKK